MKLIDTLLKPAVIGMITIIAGVSIIKGCQSMTKTQEGWDGNAPAADGWDGNKPKPAIHAIAAPLPLPTQDCHPNGCGYIDFDAHPELIGGGLVYEPVN